MQCLERIMCLGLLLGMVGLVVLTFLGSEERVKSSLGFGVELVDKGPHFPL